MHIQRCVSVIYHPFDDQLLTEILGIYPREPRNRKKASKSSTHSTTFYYTKDIQFLLHEPLLNKFREQKALAKKIARSLGRGEVGDAARLEKTGKTRISLDHIIKERYPTFVDALRDLDDALSLLFLFSALPSTSTVPPKTIALCQRLCHEFEHYLIVTHTLRKSFLSIKGIYFQATIQGQDILWLTPYRFVQRVTGDVDFRIMGTFVEFYATLLGFVNYRLYNSIGLIYPPEIDLAKDEKGGELSAFDLRQNRIETVPERQIKAFENDHSSTSTGQSDGNQGLGMDLQKRVDEIAKLPDLENNHIYNQTASNGNDEAIDKFEVADEGGDALEQPRISDSDASQLFAPYSFYLSRETPRQPLELLLRAFGCKRIGWDAVLGDGGFTHDEADQSVTHQIVDRPPLAPLDYSDDKIEDPSDPARITRRPVSKMLGRIYIQPQWVWDCANAGRLLRPDLYAPGATLPPHLSPWVKPSKSAYDPNAPLAEQEPEGEAERHDLEENERREPHHLANLTDELVEAVSADTEAAETNDMEIADENPSSSASNFDGFESEDVISRSSDISDDSDIRKSQYDRELEAEAAGLPFSSKSVNGKNGSSIKGIAKSPEDDVRRKFSKKKREEEEELERRKMMMSKKKRKLYEKMAYSNHKRDEEAEKLRRKRRKLERAKKGATAS